MPDSRLALAEPVRPAAPISPAPAGGTPRVYLACGTSAGHDPAHRAAAVRLGTDLARAGIGLVHGGGAGGLAASAAGAVLDAGGTLTAALPHGTAPDARDAPTVGRACDVRPWVTADEADAVVVLPGGFDALGELIGYLAGSEPGRPGKPVIVVDLDGFWQPFLRLVDRMRDKGFVSRDRLSCTVVRSVEEILPVLRICLRSTARRGAASTARSRALTLAHCVPDTEQPSDAGYAAHPVEPREPAHGPDLTLPPP